jgi:uncharacterized membrane protein
MHPPFVHFVVALPLVALFSQFTYMVTKDKAYSDHSFCTVGIFVCYTQWIERCRKDNEC